MIPISTKSDQSEPNLEIEDPKIIGNQWSRKMTVYTDGDEIYYNIPVSMTTPENLIEIELYRYLDSNMMKKITNDPSYDFQVVDFDGNGLNDIVKWVIPELSEVSFSVEGKLDSSLPSLTKVIREWEGNETKIQLSAEIGKPVKWKMRVKTTNESIAKESIPKDAENIITTESVETGIKEYELEYETPAPYKTESAEQFIQEEKYKKRITIESNFSEHYKNVKAYTDIPEELSQEKYKIVLYHVIDGSKIDVTDNPQYTVSFVDSDDNGVNDRIEWNIPQLSVQEFEVEASLAIINIQSYPTVSGNWVVQFNTTGTANLTVKAVSGTEFNNDLDFIELRCGDDILTTELIDGVIFIENYTCDKVGYEISKVLTSGKHTLEFRFGDDVKYAYNQALLAYYYNESLSQSTTTSTSYQDKVSITFTPISTKNYTILGYAEINSSSTSYQVEAVLTVDGTIYQNTSYRPKDANDIYPLSTIKKIELSSAQHTVQIQYRSSSGSATAKIRNAKLIVMELDPEYNESEGQSTTTSTTESEKVRLVFTPPSTGDYLIIASADIGHSDTGDSVRTRLYIDGTEYANSLIEPVVATPSSYYSFGVFKNATLDATQHIINLTWNNDDAAATTAYIKYAHLAAIRLSYFQNAYYNESESLEAPTLANVWYNKTWNFYTAQNAEHLLLYTTHRKAGTGNQIQTRFVNDSTIHDYSRQEAKDATDYWSHFWFTKATLTAGSHTDIVQYGIPRGTPSNFAVKFVRTIVLEMTEGDETSPTYSLNSTNSTTAGTPVLHSLNWTDNVGLSGYIFSFDNCTGTLVNDSSWVSFSGETWSNVTKTINSTAICIIRWCVYANDTSNNWNGTSCQNPFSYITTSAANIVEITLSQTLSNGIIFGYVVPDTIGNPARNNTSGPTGETEYNVTVGAGSTNNIDFYVKLNETFESGIYVNESSSTSSATAGFSTNTTVDASWSILGNTTSNCTNIVVNGNCWMRLYFDVVSGVSSGYKQRNYTICGVITGNNPSICG